MSTEDNVAVCCSVMQLKETISLYILYFIVYLYIYIYIYIYSDRKYSLFNF